MTSLNESGSIDLTHGYKAQRTGDDRWVVSRKGTVVGTVDSVIEAVILADVAEGQRIRLGIS